MTSHKELTDEVRVLSRALDQAGDVLDAVHADDLDKPTPCVEWTVAQLADHLIQAPANFRIMMRGDEPDWSSPPPHVAEGWGPAFRIHADDLIHEWHQSGDTSPSPADFQTAEIATHTWDLARAVGFPIERLDPEAAQRGLAFIRGGLTPENRGRAFADAQPAPAEAGPYERLAAFAGREV